MLTGLLWLVWQGFLALASSPPARLELIPGRQVAAYWSDGRAAKATRVRYTPVLVPHRLQVVENTCTASVGANCRLETYRVNHQYTFQWEKHPDKSKLGETATWTKCFGFNFVITLFGGSSFNSMDANIRPILGRDVPKDRLTCDDYRWMPGGTASFPPAALDVARWDGERMTRNDDTGISENRSVVGALDLRWTRHEAGGLALTQVGPVMSRFDSSHGLYLGDHAALWIQRPGAEACLITFKITSEKNGPFTKSKPRPLIFGEDELTQPDSYLITFISKLMKEPTCVFD